METGKRQAKKSFVILLLILVLSLAYTSYGDTWLKPSPLTWRYQPAEAGSTSITMRATTADTNDPPVQYSFECTNDANKNSGWQADANYVATGLDPNKQYSFKVQARDNATPQNVTGFSSVKSATTDISTTPAVFRLDFNAATDNNDANTLPGFTPFIIANSGNEVNGVIVDLGGDILSVRRTDPCGWYYGHGGDPCVYTYCMRAGEDIYRDFIYGFGSPPSGVTITLWGLGVNRDCNITIWAYDYQSTGDANRVANWYSNGTYIFDTNFMGGSAGVPRYAESNPEDLCRYAWSKTVTTDDLGRIVLTSSRDPCSPAAEPFAFVNALKVEPKGNFVETKYAHRPQPVDGAEDVLVNVVLSWRPGDANKHDVYFDTDFDDVNDANRTSHSNLLIYEPNHDANTFDPCGLTGFLKLDQTYYWRIDEVNGSTIWKGEVWSFTTSLCAVVEYFNSYVSNADLRAVWKDYYTQPLPVTSAEVSTEQTTVRSGLKWDGISGQSMKYWYRNDLTPFYSEARADIAALPSHIGSDWTANGVKSLVLWFYGQLNNDANEKMYVKLYDNADVNAKVIYGGDMNDIRKKEWQEWNIDLAKFTGVDLNNVKKITIGFGENDGIDPGVAPTGNGTVYFEDIQLYAARCALLARSADFALLDYAPSAVISGDCVINYQEIEVMAETWLYGDDFIPTQNPGDANCVAYWPMDEGGGNNIYSHPKFITYPDFCDTNWTGTFNVSDVTWLTPGVGIQGKEDPNYTLQFNITSGVRCGRHIPSTNGLTLAIWAKWAGQRPPDYPNYCYKPQGIFSERGGWSNTCVRFMFECDTFGNGTFALRQYSPLCNPSSPSCCSYECCNEDPPYPPSCCFESGSTCYSNTDVYAPNNLLMGYIGQWVHLAATFDGSIAKLYLNGGEVASGPFFFGYVNDPCCEPATLKIGENQVGYEAFGGELDEAYIFNRALEPNEIGYLSDTTPGDEGLYVPVPSAANVYDGNEIPPYVGEQPQGQRSVNFKDFALVVRSWLTEEMFPR